MSNNQELLKRFAIVAFSLAGLLSTAYVLTEYLEQPPVQYNRELSIAQKTSPTAGQSNPEAPFDPRSWTPIRLAARGSIGFFSDYYDRYGLRYYREAYDGECYDLDEFRACWGSDDPYFPNPHMAWI